jgi:hypothetical protein
MPVIAKVKAAAAKDPAISLRMINPLSVDSTLAALDMGKCPKFNRAP